jgi:hypothetical protein
VNAFFLTLAIFFEKKRFGSSSALFRKNRKNLERPTKIPKNTAPTFVSSKKWGAPSQEERKTTEIAGAKE